MSETTNETKQFLDKIGLDALWNKICSIFASKQELEDVKDEILLSTLVQSDWNETNELSVAFIKNKTHGETLTDVNRIGSYRHTNDITYIKHNGNTFKLELGVRTQIHDDPLAWVTLYNPNTMLIEVDEPELDTGISAHLSEYPITIIDIQKIDAKYLPDEVLNSSRVTIEYSNGTLNMSNVNEINYNAGTLNLTL